MKIEKMNLYKSLFVSLMLVSAIGFLSSCEDIVDIKTATGESQLVVEGWINNQPGEQMIRLTWSSAYFDNSPAKPVLGAEVTVKDNLGNVYHFLDKAGNGMYIWNSENGTDTLGHIGRKYSLTVKNGVDTYTSESEIKRVPAIDSVVYQNETLPFEPDKGPTKGYIAEFYARDFEGAGDTYWIKPVISGKVRTDNPVNISIAYDAAFSAGAPSDGLIFILPIRQSITTDSLYSAGDSVGVELHSITHETFDYLKQINEQAANGGLFATPIANIKSNIVNVNPAGPKPLGFFGCSAISRMETKIDPAKARPEED